MSDFESSPGFLIRRMQQVSVSHFLDQLREFGITPLQYTILRIIESQPGIDQVTVATKAFLDASTVKDIVARLESRGLAQRKRGEHDRRTRTVSLTQASADLLAVVEPTVRETQRNLLAPLSRDEQTTLLRLLRTLISAHESRTNYPAVPTPWRRFNSLAESVSEADSKVSITSVKPRGGR